MTIAAGVTVRTEGGALIGVPSRCAAVTAYRGIPYGASTAGPNRWRVPQPAAPWPGTRVADTFGHISPRVGAHQSVPHTGPDPEVDQSEDCLNLNVWTGATNPAERRPVLVWIHGGRFSFGHAAESIYDGAGLAARGPVVVTVNFRTGVLGFLATPELSAESGHGASGNYGLLDAIAALGWVRRNIAAFGGDPDRVTIAGQSSGGATVLDLLYSPLARGMFHRVIAQSAALYPQDPAISTLAASPRQLATAERQGVAYAAGLGVTTAAELRSLPLAELLVGSDGNDPSIPGAPPPPLFRPVIDGWVLPQNYGDTLRTGSQADVPVMVGSNRDESGVQLHSDISSAQYEQWAADRYGEFAAEFLELYPAPTGAAAADQRNAAFRDAMRVSNFLWAGEFSRATDSPVFSYFWTRPPAGPVGAAGGAYHGAEIAYLLDNLAVEDQPHTAEDHCAADTAAGYLSNFVTFGDPNGPGLPAWSAVETSAPITQQIGDGWAPIPIADEARVDFFRRFWASRPSW